MSISYPSVPVQFEMLREMTRSTGVLVEAQLRQLKLWPMVLFSECMTAESRVDFSKKTVSFLVSYPSGAEKLPFEVFKERNGYLGAWVQELLGEEWAVDVVVESGSTSMEMTVARKIKSVEPHPLSGAKRS